MFKITQGKGFHITLSNGMTLSVQWGPGNYCENRSDDRLIRSDYSSGEEGSKDCEIALWREGESRMLPLQEHDDVAGWVSPDQVARILGLLVDWKGDETLKAIREVLDPKI